MTHLCRKCFVADAALIWSFFCVTSIVNFERRLTCKCFQTNFARCIASNAYMQYIVKWKKKKKKKNHFSENTQIQNPRNKFIINYIMLINVTVIILLSIKYIK